MNKSDIFAKLIRAWDLLTPPLRPNSEVVAAIGRELGGNRGPGLLLGATTEFAGLIDDMVAIDISPTMLSALWLKNAAHRRAVVGDWRRMPFAAATFSACIADGSPTLMRWSEELQLFLEQVAAVLRPGAPAVFRVFSAPDRAETMATIKDASMNRTIGNFHAYKWRIGMALASKDRQFNTTFGAIYDAFDAMFPDRGRLVRDTGWSRPQIDAIEQYKGADSLLSFPPRAPLAELASKSFEGVRFVDAGTYELADCCPLLVMQRR
ncbi:class I SAM-dependent methyltransferase [Rhodoplanes sp. Z2-YC6860]|uniref:class I SAM-dependent methyltransferase n=1 Tax=Rhodoplanes sp. Z2-YC6860 TaxID=674703 RepID=UPI00078CAACD|nr:class I SAM-dependent methyltransferase [Rhodoplanes sp. Z2-YC6860]AMN43138.1 SAM-dependent methyltransferase, type 11 [Rhodoplanes sp. Z2-YC6860]